MIEALLLLTGVVTGAAVALLVVRRRREVKAPPTRRILFPYVGSQLSVRALDAALRIARTEDARLVAAYLMPVPMALSLDAPMPRACGAAFELQEAIEQRAQAAGIAVDARIETGRTVRHALRRLLEDEPFDRLVVAARTAHTDGLSAAEVAWLLEHAPGEVAVIRPADESVLDGQHRVVQPQERPAPQPQRMVGVHV
jgi:nucleotide-binding universal stress UspA family protein